MADHFPVGELTSSAAAAPAARVERRQMRRAGISLLVRIRTADFNDGSFEEMRTTQNASRKAIYFFTKLDRYYKGMRVRITSPYDPNSGSGNLEQNGEVVRVHRREDGYGVAIALSSCGYTAPPPSPAAKPSYAQSAAAQAERDAIYSQSERRCANRSAFIAPVEMVEVRTGARIQARTSDLSPQGCYVDTLNPLQAGAAVRLQIQRGDKVLDVLANVSSRHAGSGMGLVFAELTPAQCALLGAWLEELALPPRTVFAEPFPANNKVASSSGDSAARLVQVLVRKGILSQSEATEVFRDISE